MQDRHASRTCANRRCVVQETGYSELDINRFQHRFSVPSAANRVEPALAPELWQQLHIAKAMQSVEMNVHVC